MIRKNFLSALFIVIAFFAINKIIAQDANSIENGKYLFESNCARCHGKSGTKGLFGAKNLRISKLNDEALLHIIIVGKKIMPSWEKKLTQSQIEMIISYIKTLRQ